MLCVILLALCAIAPASWGREAAPAADNPALEKRTMDLAEKLRCLVCQNQTIADSQSGLATDLRQQVRELLQRGNSERQIIDYMTARYGDFVLYRPPLKSSTMLLWFGPAVLLIAGVLTLIVVLRRRSKLSDDQFEADPQEAEEAR